MYDTISSVALSILSVSFDAGVRTAYLSRGKVVEDRPIEANELRLAARLGEDERFGRMGVYHFDYSSLTDRCEPRNSWFMREFNWGAFYHYDLALAEDWTLANEVMPYWALIPHADPSMEWWFIQSLRNPYVVPSWFMRRGTVTSDFTYFKLGLQKPLSCRDIGWERLTVTPGVFAELGNSALMTGRYGLRENGSGIPTGIQSVIVELCANYRINENFRLFATLQQFDLVNADARKLSHKPNCRDLTVFMLGVTVGF